MMTESANSAGNLGGALLTMLYFGGVIAINLAVMNMLPIPALDGGRCVGLLLTTVIEKIIRKKLNPKYEGYVHAVGFVILIALMVIITFKDIFMFIKG
jgi:regulator of sigma E protease